MRVSCVILARSGSKGIPKKNIIDFCGKPLIAWTIEQCLTSKHISDVWVSSNSQDILDVAEEYGAKTIKRPEDISGDLASSESGWRHAIETIQKYKDIDLVLAPQVTSPLRETKDIDNAIELFKKEKYDSMFSSCIVKDLFYWQKDERGQLQSINYDYLNRKRRQDTQEKIIENGSFYIFKPENIQKYNNRFGGEIGHFEMDLWKMFEIDNIKDLKTCRVLMQGFLLNN